MLQRVKIWARRLGDEVAALFIAARDPRTPRLAKLVALAVAAYTLSPIDLIPDFIPVLGYLDDLIILPLGIMLAVRLIPVDLMAEFRHTALNRSRPPAHWSGPAAIVTLWFAGAALLGWWIFR